MTATTWRVIDLPKTPKALEIRKELSDGSSATAIVYAFNLEAYVFPPRDVGLLRPAQAKEVAQALDYVANQAELVTASLRAWGGDTTESRVEAMKRKVENEQVTA